MSNCVGQLERQECAQLLLKSIRGLEETFFYFEG